MNDNAGTFIVLEGSDGSGKTTQFKLLNERLSAVGYDIAIFDFPQYEKPSAYFVRQYLNGAYGPASAISPYTASLFYALDRFEAAESIKAAINEGKVVVANRYVGSNMAHQGSKFSDPGKQRGFFVWEDGLEYNLLGIPRPSLNLFLRVPAEISYQLINNKAARNYTNKSHDQHEADLEHLKNSVNTYELLSKLFPKDFLTIECTEGGRLLSVPEINNKIWGAIQPVLPPRPLNKSRRAVINLDNLDSKPKRAGPKPGKAISNNAHTLSLEIKNISLLGVGLLVGAADVKPSYKLTGEYYRPNKLNKDASTNYRASLRRIADIQNQIKARMEKAANVPKAAINETVELLTPSASLVNLNLSGKKSDFINLIGYLSGIKNSEALWLSGQLRAALGRLDGAADVRPKNDSLKDDYISLFLNGSISSRNSLYLSEVNLLAAKPRNEFELLADIIYANADLSKDEIIREMNSWPYVRKQSALQALVNPEFNASVNLNYDFDAIVTLPAIKYLAGAGIADRITMQAATVRYGYDLPAAIEKLRLDDLFLEAFDISLSLFSRLQDQDDEGNGPYATLLGHKRRCAFSVNYQSLAKLSKLDKSSIAALAAEQIKEKIREVHPIVAASVFDGGKIKPGKKLNDKSHLAPKKAG